MSAIRRATILKLAAAAYEIDLNVANGLLTRDEEGKWRIGEMELDHWLAANEGNEAVLILGSLADERPIKPRTCLTCGRDYTDLECPYCRANRIRLRGAP